jgi:glutathione S-transferase
LILLIGQFDSPFTRRIGIMMRLYEIPFEHRPWSTFANAEQLAQINPLIRVPTVVLENGDVLVETHLIMDYLNHLMPPARTLLAQTQPERYRTQHVIALASGISDKAVSLFYEQRLHDVPSEVYVARLTKQITGAMIALEKMRRDRLTLYWHGNDFDQADITVACTLRHLREAFPEMFDQVRYPALHAHAEIMEKLPVFQKIQQPFIAPT